MPDLLDSDFILSYTPREKRITCDVCGKQKPENKFHESDSVCDDCVFELMDQMGGK